MNFVRKDSVEHSWAIIDSLKDSIDGQAPEQYPVHSWGRSRRGFTGEIGGGMD
ncbi:hypothetical protein [Chlorobaculum limnaeum]|uniref:hypothetical protein n=1 Tax=Chlorobaculum limnaeum TaxID=274537 RepID=UPI000A018731